MDFMNRGRQAPEASQGQAMPSSGGHGGRQKHFDWGNKVVRIEWFIFTLLVAIVLLIAIGWAIWNGSTVGYSETNQVNTAKYQAVFLNGGSTSGSVAYTTYFGHITKLTPQYMILKNVYYLTTTSSSSSSTQVQPQLTKLGCQQLHSPYDEMVINRSQVAFWENLQDSGKVVTAIKQFVKQNPNGPNCNATSSTNSSSNNQSKTSTGTSNTNSGSSTTTP